MFNVKIEDREGESGYEINTFLIITDDSGTQEYWDHGEPEDNSFHRDYNWVKPALEAAYAQGVKDGASSAVTEE